MDYNKAALEMHESHKGKVGIVSKVEVATRDDLSTAYTPGVAEPCRKIKANPEDVYKYTFKGNMVAVVSNGTAVLGLGDIGPEAGLPVMEGKAVLFKEFGGVDAFPICINAHSAEEVIAACKAIAPTFGGINLEDIKSPECFEIEQTLEKELDIPVFHDDQHGTAIVVTAALINALRVVGKKMEDVHIVLNGPGAAGTAITNILGLVCDPIAGLVEAPCQKRNAMGASNAIVAAQITLAGVGNLLPLDEVIDVMYSVGRSIPFELRETALGGVAGSPTGCRLSKQIFG